MSEMQNYLQSQVPMKLKTFMSKAEDVDHWNQLREIAKGEYSFEIINLLDASGFIRKVIKVSDRLVA